MISVLLADDHALMRNGVRSLLEGVRTIRIVGEASNGREAVGLAKQTLPDVAVLDVAMGQLSGIEAARQIRTACPGTRVVMLSMHADEEYVGAALRAGVCGYVLKSEAFGQLLAAIQSVQAGGIYLSPQLAERGLEEYRLGRESGQASALDKITKREREILQLIAEGNSNAEIARKLGIGIRTVETHRARLMDKLRVFTTAGLTRLAIRCGLVSP